MAVLLLTAGSLFALPSAACACSCALGSEAEYREHADLIFTGVVVDINEPLLRTSSAAPVEVTFAVEDVDKGVAVGRITLTTADSSASCGYDFTVGHRFTVYAKNGGTGLCSGNRAIGPAPEIAVDSGFPLSIVVGTVGGLAAVGVAIIFWRRRMARTGVVLPPRHS